MDDSQNRRIPNEALAGPGICAWGETDYLEALTLLAAELDLPLEDCAKRFGILSLPASESGWRFHPALGFTRKKE
ncbi:CRISPR-associated nuclease/helicase Cas3 subtype I-F/YPEST [compost metagenome]